MYIYICVCIYYIYIYIYIFIFFTAFFGRRHRVGGSGNSGDVAAELVIVRVGVQLGWLLAQVVAS